jgi:hypothetical protein
MSEMNRSFAGSMPELYDRILVPVMFEPFAQDLAERLREMKSGHILEIGAAKFTPWSSARGCRCGSSFIPSRSRTATEPAGCSTRYAGASRGSN